LIKMRRKKIPQVDYFSSFSEGEPVELKGRNQCKIS
jgi:hypothetical protein